MAWRLLRFAVVCCFFHHTSDFSENYTKKNLTIFVASSYYHMFILLVQNMQSGMSNVTRKAVLS